MIRLCARLICQDITRYNNILILLRTDCIIQRPRTIYSLGISNCTNNISSVVVPPVKDDEQVSQIFSSPHVISIIETAQTLGFSESEIAALMKKQPELIQTNSNLWNDIVGLLLRSGFKNNDVMLMLEKWPKILRMKKNDLENNLLAWLNCGFGGSLLFQILTTYPHFLQVNHKHVSRRIKQYQLYFENKKRVGKLLLLAPNLLEEQWSILEVKLNYLDELCTDKSDVVSSGALAYSIFHIKARHEFLIRAGVYKRPQKDFHKRLSKNPKLESIVNTTNEEFVSKIAKLSMFEFSVFLEIFKTELEDSSDIYDSDDEDMKLSYYKNTFNK